MSLEELNKLNLNITKEIIDSGYALVVTTTLNDMKTIRLCMINANSTTEDILNTMDLLDQIAVKQYKALCEKGKS